MVDLMKLSIKGVVTCPACKKEYIYVYSDASGHNSVPCIRCQRIVLVDNDNLTAQIISPVRKTNLNGVMRSKATGNRMTDTPTMLRR